MRTKRSVTWDDSGKNAAARGLRYRATLFCEISKPAAIAWHAIRCGVSISNATVKKTRKWCNSFFFLRGCENSDFKCGGARRPTGAIAAANKSKRNECTPMHI